MIELAEFFAIQARLLEATPLTTRRALFKQVSWNSRLIAVSGPRGTGKTTLLLQYLSDLATPGSQKHLYVSADHVRVEALGLYELAASFFRSGGELLVVDEVQKRAEWAKELKSLYDSFPQARIFVSGSSPIELQGGKADLSRRAVYYTLPALSFREYLQIAKGIDIAALGWPKLLEEHVALAHRVLAYGPILGEFRRFLESGAYPFFVEGVDTYQQRLINVIDKVLYQDIPGVAGMNLSGVPALKKILWQVASSQPFQLNVERLSSNLGVSKPTLYNYLAYLEQAGLILSVMPQARGSARLRKPEKLFMANTNLIRAVGNPINIEDPKGNVRETFFASQARAAGLKVRAAKQGDFILDDKHTFEVGGRQKSAAQVAGQSNAFVVRDDIEVGAQGVLPLWTFGFLY